MRDDQLGARFDRLGRAGRRDRQASHQLRDVPIAMADQQPDVVPFLGQSEGGKLFEKRGDGSDRGHGSFPLLGSLPSPFGRGAGGEGVAAYIAKRLVAIALTALTLTLSQKERGRNGSSIILSQPCSQPSDGCRNETQTGEYHKRCAQGGLLNIPVDSESDAAEERKAASRDQTKPRWEVVVRDPGGSMVVLNCRQRDSCVFLPQRDGRWMHVMSEGNDIAGHRQAARHSHALGSFAGRVAGWDKRSAVPPARRAMSSVGLRFACPTLRPRIRATTAGFRRRAAFPPTPLTARSGGGKDNGLLLFSWLHLRQCKLNL